MKKTKEFIVNLFHLMFEENYEGKNRRLVIDKKTGKIDWSKGALPFGEGPDEKEIAESEKSKPFGFEDEEKQGTRMFKPLPHSYEVFRENRFEVEFPGIPGYAFQSYNYMGTDVHSKKKWFSSDEIIKNDYSSFKVLMLFPHEFDICEKFKELEESPKVGNIIINLLDPTGVTVKQIVIPGCEVTEIKAFRNLDYKRCSDKSDDVLYGEIIVKHKQRKLI